LGDHNQRNKVKAATSKMWKLIHNPEKMCNVMCLRH
jgi:hypothetical protein